MPFSAYAAHRIVGSIKNGIQNQSELREQLSWKRRMQKDRIRSLVSEATPDGADAMAALSDLAVGLTLGFMLEDTTLEMTPGGAWLDNQALFKIKRLPPEMVMQPWERLSQRYAQGASGSVSTFIDGASTRGVFYRVELPALQANPNVTLILRNANQPVRLSR